MAWENNQKPDTYDFLASNRFKLSIDGLPNVSYTCQHAILPSITTDPAIRETPFVKIPLPGDKIVFDNFQVQFLVSDEMENYLELFNWMQCLGFPDNYKQYRSLVNLPINARALDSKNLEVSDATLVVFSAANNPKLTVQFHDLFPISLSGLEFNITSIDAEPLTATVTFAYTTFEFNIP